MIAHWRAALTATLCSLWSSCASASLVPVRMIDWQGCPDCTKYGDGLVKLGLKKGLGSIMNMQAFLTEGSHPGIASDPRLHPWVACGNNVSGAADPGYFWYQVAACANPGKTVADCVEAVGATAEQVKPIYDCMDGPAAAQLVAAMHQQATGFEYFPWASVGEQVMKEPDLHGDNIRPLIAAVCKQAAASLGTAALLPEACHPGGSASSSPQAWALLRTIWM